MTERQEYLRLTHTFDETFTRAWNIYEEADHCVGLKPVGLSQALVGEVGGGSETETATKTPKRKMIEDESEVASETNFKEQKEKKKKVKTGLETAVCGAK